MMLGRVGRWLLAVLSLTAAVLAACAPSAEPAAKGPVAEERTTEPVGPVVTAYVVGYHWGWAIFDEDGTELEVLRVPTGATVELFAVNDHAEEAIELLPAPVAETIEATDWHERVHHDIEAGRMPDPAEEMGMGVDDLLGEAHNGDGGHQDPDASEDHGLMITGLGIQLAMEAHAREPERVVFTASEDGTYTFVCTVYCGFGHEHMNWEMLEVGAV